MLLLLCFVVSFLITFLTLPIWIKAAKKAGLVGRDMNKYEKPEIAEIGGICVVAGLLSGLLFYIGIKTFYFKSTTNIVELLALISTVLIITIVGIIDDALGWKIGIKRRYKPLLCLAAAVPLMVIAAGYTKITIPLLGSIDIGLLYPLLIVPLAIVGASNGFNMLAGYNGLEAGMGIIILATLGAVTWQIGTTWIALVSFCAVSALIAFLFYNHFPAKVFPGNTLTYAIGALIACVTILGNVERAALILFIPYFLELGLKTKGKFKKESFGLPKKDGSLELRYPKIYGLEHIAIVILKKLKPSHKVYEQEIVVLLLLVEVIIATTIIF